MSIEEKMDMLRRKIKAGALGADDARRALWAEIDGELRKAAADVDMDAVNACDMLTMQEFLRELAGFKQGKPVKISAQVLLALLCKYS